MHSQLLDPTTACQCSAHFVRVHMLGPLIFFIIIHPLKFCFFFFWITSEYILLDFIQILNWKIRIMIFYLKTHFQYVLTQNTLDILINLSTLIKKTPFKTLNLKQKKKLWSNLLFFFSLLRQKAPKFNSFYQIESFYTKIDVIKINANDICFSFYHHNPMTSLFPFSNHKLKYKKINFYTKIELRKLFVWILKPSPIIAHFIL